MSTKHLLNFHLSQPLSFSESEHLTPTLVFIHGLFGDMNNLGVIARAFADQYPILRVDLRNHGHSFHTQEMNYDLLAQDLIDVLVELNLQHVILVGHSMGGKTAMKAAAMRPDLVEKLVVIDIAPVNYGEHGHRTVFAALNAVKNAQVNTRQEAKPILRQFVEEEAVCQFMLKSFEPKSSDRFRFYLPALEDNYLNLMNWQPVFFDKPTLFIKGGTSNYILPEYQSVIMQQFPQAQAFVVNGSGHWVHAEKTDFVIRAIQRFLKK